MDLLLTPATLRGAVTPPPSKSRAHRLLLAAALGAGTCRVAHVGRSQDMDATRRCLEALGASFRDDGEDVVVTGMFSDGWPEFSNLPLLDCGESGSTLRFLIPVALAVAGGGVFVGRGRLLERPLEPYWRAFAPLGIRWRRSGDTLTVEGRLQPGTYRLPGDVSSQFFTGLLFALPLLSGPSRLESTTALESADYLAMTCEALAAAGVSVTSGGEPPCFEIAGRAAFALPDGAVEADWSQAAFFVAAAALGSPVTLTGMDETSSQGDRIILAYSRRLTAGGRVTLDVRPCPDLVPALAVQAALRDGAVTELTGAARLRLKESDRLAAVTAVLNGLGARVTEHPDSLTIVGVPALAGGDVSACNDHRIAMMAAVAATRCRGPVRLRGAECVAKSYPDFWQVYAALGGRLQEV